MTDMSQVLSDQQSARGGGRSGIALVIAILLLSALTILGAMVFSIFSIDLRSVAHFKHGCEAFESADAGADYVLAELRKAVNAGTLTIAGSSVSMNITSPVGFSFDPVTNLLRLADNRSYLFEVTGRSGISKATIEVVLESWGRDVMGVFGDEDVSMAPNTEIYSYRSSQTTSPTPLDSTGEASVGTNEEMGGKPDAVDGVIYLGEDASGVPANYPNESTSPATVTRVPRIDPDPFGVVGGYLETRFNEVAVSNSNSHAVGGSISGGMLEVAGDVTLTAGDYYVSQIDIDNNKTLTIDASGGAVSIYLTGGVDFAPNSLFAMNPPVPGLFRVYSNSTEPVMFMPHTDVNGVIIYAPLADVTIKPVADFHGMVWGRTVDMQPGGVCYIDLDAIEDLSMAGKLDRISWRRVR